MVQLYIPGNTFHTARVTGKRRWFLGGSTEWPGVVQRDRDVELGKIDRLAAKYPEAAADIRQIPRAGREVGVSAESALAVVPVSAARGA